LNLRRDFFLWSFALLAACSWAPEEQPAGPQVLARVGETDITADKLERALEALYPPGAAQPASKERQALERLIDMEVLLLAARDQGLEHDWQVENIVARKEQELLLEELYRRGVLKSEEEITREEARVYFERHRIGQERRLSRILLTGPAAADQALSRLRAGEDFARVASELSEDGETAAQGGDLGWMSRLSFKSHLLRRQVFDAEVGQLIGPFQEPDGFSILMATGERQVPFESAATAVEQAMREQKRTLDTFKYLEGLADQAHIEEREKTLHLLLARLSEAGREMPQFKKGEGREVLFSTGQVEWTLDHFMAAMVSERDQAEIRSLEDLRLYAHRLFALKVLLPRRARELGIHQAENVARPLERTRREALVDRLRQIEVIERIDPGEEQVRAYYEKHRDRYARSERISILEVLADTRAQADSLLAQAERGGDLEELSRRYSKRSPRIRRAGGRLQLLRPDKYGNIGWEAKDAREGELVGPVRTQQGYSVFKVLKKIPGYEQSFEEARGRAATHLREELIQQGFDRLLARLRDRYQGQVRLYEEHLQAYLASLKSA
jgi:peptidyl-prolyl cis-trans isomerase C